MRLTIRSNGPVATGHRTQTLELREGRADVSIGVSQTD